MEEKSAEFNNEWSPMPNTGRPMPASSRNPSNSRATGIVTSILILVLMAIVYSFVIFLIIEITPEYQAVTIVDSEVADAQIRQFIIMENDLKESLIIRYIRLMAGNFGISMITGQQVNYLIVGRLPTTVVLILTSLVVTFVFAIPIGILSAVMHNRIADVIFSTISVLCKSIPFFLLALLLLKWFSFDLGWLPTAGAVSWRGYVLPVVTLGFSYFGFAAQAIRATVIRARSNDGTGLFFPERNVNNGRTLISAILPTIPKSGMQLGWLFSGIIIVEQLFAMPGVGGILLQGINTRDTPVVLGGIATLSYCFIVISAIIGLVFAGVFRLFRPKSGK